MKPTLLLNREYSWRRISNCNDCWLGSLLVSGNLQRVLFCDIFHSNVHNNFLENQRLRFDDNSIGAGKGNSQCKSGSRALQAALSPLQSSRSSEKNFPFTAFLWIFASFLIWLWISRKPHSGRQATRPRRVWLQFNRQLPRIDGSLCNLFSSTRCLSCSLGLLAICLITGGSG